MSGQAGPDEPRDPWSRPLDEEATAGYVSPDAHSAPPPVSPPAAGATSPLDEASLSPPDVGAENDGTSAQSPAGGGSPAGQPPTAAERPSGPAQAPGAFPPAYPPPPGAAPGHGPSAQPGYPPRPGYPGYPPQPGYPGYPPQQTYPGQHGHPGQQGYPGQHGYPGQQGYPGQPGYPAPPGHLGQQGYPGYPAIHGDPGYGASSAGAAAPYNLDAYGMPVPVRTDPMAATSMGVGIASLVLTFLGCCCMPLLLLPGLGGIVAIVLGVVSKRNIRTDPLNRGGSGYATTGIVTGSIALTIALLLGGLMAIGTFAQFGNGLSSSA